MKAPSLLDPAFVYVPSVETDIRKTFERIRRMQNNDAGGVEVVDTHRDHVTGLQPIGLAEKLPAGVAHGPASPFARKEAK